MQRIASTGPKTATFRFRNIGPVSDAKLELGDLTILAGRNNTGKTYLVYTLYGFLKMWQSWPHANDFDSLMQSKHPEAHFPNIQSIINQLVRKGRAKLPLDDEMLKLQRRQLARELANSFSTEVLPQVFSSHHGDFEGSSIEVEFDGNIADHTQPFQRQLSKKISLTIEHDGSNLLIAINGAKNQRQIRDLEPYFTYQYFLFLLADQFPDPFILSAERFGISLFYRELDFTKNQLVDLLQKLGDDKSRPKISPFLLINRTTSRYALPIKDNIDYTRSIPDLRRAKSEIYDDKLFNRIKDMMDGYYGNAGDDIRFISKARGKGRSFNIPLHLASSSARGLSDLYFYLRHVAQADHLLIVDEPESHLDTANQILFARLLARLVGVGLRVLVTTHSDYFIKEINNLIMLSRPFPDKDQIVKKFKYGPNDLLKPDSVRAYVAKNNGLNLCEVDKFGMNMPVFDETINQINKVANDLSSQLWEEPEI